MDFRVWDKEERKFLDERYIAINGRGDILGFTGKEWEWLEWKRYIIMHYTETQDKNKKDIFEGDILEILIDNSFKRKLICRKGKITKSIIGIDKKRHLAEINGFYYESDTFDKLLPLIQDKIFSDTQKMEIIGNIYENPELMEK